MHEVNDEPEMYSVFKMISKTYSKFKFKATVAFAG